MSATEVKIKLKQTMTMMLTMGMLPMTMPALAEMVHGGDSGSGSIP